MFTGVVKGVGPRYCPSIEDKIVRFAGQRASSTILRTLRRNTEEVYVRWAVNEFTRGCSTISSISIKGLEKAEM